jgi:hypothetical protein
MYKFETPFNPHIIQTKAKKKMSLPPAKRHKNNVFPAYEDFSTDSIPLFETEGINMFDTTPLHDLLPLQPWPEQPEQQKSVEAFISAFFE